ncbi:hypothetical protein EK904_013045 [Melospiza melodia maxima]|nr:hypothetical protein EK904_013045 [Melospiza melodia maxima]
MEAAPSQANSSLLPNGTENGTLPEVPPFQYIHKVLIPICYLLVCALGLSGNALVIYVVLRHAKMKTVTNIYILNLAVADVLFMLGLPFLATQNAISYWPFGSFLCRLGLYFFMVVLSYANSCANPILYGFLSDNFKQSFQKVLCLRKGDGAEDGEPVEHRQENSSRLQESMLTQRNVEFNGHMQTSKV